jgi:hypothetical protein
MMKRSALHTDKDARHQVQYEEDRHKTCRSVSAITEKTRGGDQPITSSEFTKELSFKIS